MKRLNYYRAKLMLVIVTVSVFYGLGRAKADFTFGEPINLGPKVNSQYGEAIGSISANGLSLFFDSGRPGGLGDDIWVAHRSTKDDPWGTPVNLGSTVNSSQLDWAPCISHNGLELYFRSNRPGGQGSSDIWVTTRTTQDDTWTVPVNLGNIVNTPNFEDGPFLSVDGLSLFFDSYQRAGGYGHWDMWVTTRGSTDDPWQQPVNLGPEFNSPVRDGYLNISVDGLFCCFSSERSGGYGSADIWMAFRETTASPWKACVNAGPTLNSPYGEWGPRISSDGTALYFTDYPSPRPGGYGSTDIWMAPIIPIVDFNGDGLVDSADMCIMVDHWGEDYPLCDIGPMPWGDGIVDVEDLIVLAEHLFEEVDDPTLIAHWPLDEAQGDVAHDSAGTYDGTLIGAPVWQPEAGIVGGALQFDGIDDYVSTDAFLNTANSFLSVFAWIKGGTSGQVIISQKGRSDWLLADTTEGSLMTEIKFAGRSGGPLYSHVVITDGNWHRVGLVLDGSNRILYVDDVEVVSDIYDKGMLYGKLQIGAGKNLEPGTFFSGLIDDIRIYNNVLSAEEIATLVQ